jgi:AraC family transcriptional activator of pobA
MKSLEVRREIVPSFFLYGEPPKEVSSRFLHIEALDERSRPNDWNIRPHAHPNLNHIIHIAVGAGAMRTDRGAFSFRAPVVLLAPAGVIHAFAWEPDTAGHVLTLAEGYFRDLSSREPEFASIFAAPDSLALGGAADESDRISGAILRLAHELAWNAPAHRAAVEAQLLDLLVRIVRIANRDRPTADSPPGPQADLVARFRAMVEEHFRSSLPIAEYADRLGVSIPRLRAACINIARRAPLDIVQERLFLEAKRLLLYSNMTVAEIGYFLGFEDPAYFTRFFTRRAGQSPRRFRMRQAA